jgi:tRNA(Ile)-lysidine synthase
MANSRKPAPQADSVEDGLTAALAAVASTSHDTIIAVALSGGLDSTVLLHAATRLPPLEGRSFVALHVNHGLSPHARAWQEHCSALCEVLHVPFFARAVVLEQRASIEAAARAARYAALAELCHEHGASILLTGHHAEDQAETVLLNVLRGTGIRGLRGIAANTRLGELVVMRPLLAVRREVLGRYAQRHALRVIHDESNLDRRFTRNALRHDALPPLLRIAPTTVERLAALARHARSTDTLLTELAEIDLERCTGASTGLSIAGLGALSQPRAANLLRHWLLLHGASAPSERRLLAWHRQLCDRGNHAPPPFILGEQRFLVVAGELFVTGRTSLAPSDHVELRWQGEAYLDVAAWNGRLWIEQTSEAGIAEERLLAEPLCVRPRTGGERLQIHPARPSRTLKNLYQEAGIDAASRRWLPIVHCGRDLIFAAGIGMNLRACDELALGARRLAVRWQPFGSATSDGACVEARGD